MAALSGTTIGDAILAALNLRYDGGEWPTWCRAAAGVLLPYISQPVVADLTVNAEAADVITVDIALKNTQGTAVAAAHTVLATLYDADMDVASVGAFHLGESGDGTEITTTDRPVLLLTTSAAGAAQLEVTDVAGASGATKYLIVEVLSDGNTLGGKSTATITFD